MAANMADLGAALSSTNAVAATLSAAASCALGGEGATEVTAAEPAAAASRSAFSFATWAASIGLARFADLIAEADLTDFVDSCMTPLTIFAPTDDAIARLGQQLPGDPEQLRELLCVHLTMGQLSSSELLTTRSITTIGQQTHHITLLGEAGAQGLQVGPATLLQHDVMLPDGRGVLHTIDCVMCCLRLLQHCRYEQVWNKTVRPSPKVAINGEWNHSRDELHAILIHCDSWHPLMQGLRGHAIALQPPVGNDKGHKSFQDSCAHFSDLLILEKPPEMSKKKRKKGPDGASMVEANTPTANYRVMFSLYRKDVAGGHGKVGEERGKHLTFVMAPEDILIRNSFHMLSEEAKQARRTEYKQLTKNAQSKQKVRLDGPAGLGGLGGLGGGLGGLGGPTGAPGGKKVVQGLPPSMSLALAAEAAEAAQSHTMAHAALDEGEDDGVTPRLLALSATTGAHAGGTWVWIQGRNLAPETRVYVGRNLAQRMTYVSDCLLQISTPPATPSTGTVEVRATSTGGLEWSNELHFTYSASGGASANLSPMEGELMERQLVLMQHFVQACCGSGAEASVHQLMASSLAQPQRLLGAVLALILAGSGGMNHKGSALDLERQDAQGCTLMHYICSLRNGPALQLLLRANVDPTIADTQGLAAADWAHAYGFPEGVRLIEQHLHGGADPSGGFDASSPEPHSLEATGVQLPQAAATGDVSGLDAFLGRPPKLPTPAGAAGGEGVAAAAPAQGRSLQQFLQPTMAAAAPLATATVAGSEATSVAPAMVGGLAGLTAGSAAGVGAAIKPENGGGEARPRSLEQFLEPGQQPAAQPARSQETHHRSLAGFLTAAAAHVESTPPE